MLHTWGSALTHHPHAASRRRSSDNWWGSMPTVAHSSTALSSHTPLHRLDPNQPTRPRHSNPHSACGTASRSLKRGFLPWRLSDAGPHSPRHRQSLGRHPKPFTETDYHATIWALTGEANPRSSNAVEFRGLDIEEVMKQSEIYRGELRLPRGRCQRANPPAVQANGSSLESISGRIGLA